MRLRVSLLLIIIVSFAAPSLAQKRNITEKISSTSFGLEIHKSRQTVLASPSCA